MFLMTSEGKMSYKQLTANISSANWNCNHWF